MAKVQALEVFIGGPSGRVWVERLDKIAAARVKHFAEAAEYQPGTDQYKRLLEISSRQNEIEDWARRFIAPKQLRDSWYHARIAVKEFADEASFVEAQRAHEEQAKKTAAAMAEMEGEPAAGRVLR